MKLAYLTLVFSAIISVFAVAEQTKTACQIDLLSKGSVEASEKAVNFIRSRYTDPANIVYKTRDDFGSALNSGLLTNSLRVDSMLYFGTLGKIFAKNLESRELIELADLNLPYIYSIQHENGFLQILGYTSNNVAWHVSIEVATRAVTKSKIPRPANHPSFSKSFLKNGQWLFAVEEGVVSYDITSRSVIALYPITERGFKVESIGENGGNLYVALQATNRNIISVKEYRLVDLSFVKEVVRYNYTDPQALGALTIIGKTLILLGSRGIHYFSVDTGQLTGFVPIRFPLNISLLEEKGQVELILMDKGQEEGLQLSSFASTLLTIPWAEFIANLVAPFEAK